MDGLELNPIKDNIMNPVFDYLVVGKGLVGGATGRYMSQFSPRVAIVGPDEPADYTAPGAIFASHYDEGRLTHRLSRDLVWGWLGQRAIRQYPFLERQSGITFHRACGSLVVGRNMAGFRREVAENLGIDCRFYGADGLRQQFPMFGFPAGYEAMFELPPAGYINPRAMLQAQLTIASQQGATIIAEKVVRLRAQRNGMKVLLDSGRELTAGMVLLATGSFSNCFDLLPRPLALRVKSETTILAEISSETAGHLANMPTLIYDIDSPWLTGIYLTPPIRYPDGRFYIKLGCDTTADQTFTSLTEMQAWMVSGRDDGMAEVILQALKRFMPGLPILSMQPKRCLVTYTRHGKPYIDQIGERLFVAVGGNGTSAKCADTLGYLAAQMVSGRAWPAPFSRSTFQLDDGVIPT